MGVCVCVCGCLSLHVSPARLIQDIPHISSVSDVKGSRAPTLTFCRIRGHRQWRKEVLYRLWLDKEMDTLPSAAKLNTIQVQVKNSFINAVQSHSSWDKSPVHHKAIKQHIILIVCCPRTTNKNIIPFLYTMKSTADCTVTQ